jgi:hypothetical protein
VPTAWPFVGPTGTPIASNWSALINMAAGVGDTLFVAEVLFVGGVINTQFAWTGFTGSGALANNCGDWQSGGGNGNYVTTPEQGYNATWASGVGGCFSYWAEVMCLCWNP